MNNMSMANTSMNTAVTVRNNCFNHTLGMLINLLCPNFKIQLNNKPRGIEKVSVIFSLAWVAFHLLEKGQFSFSKSIQSLYSTP